METEIEEAKATVDNMDSSPRNSSSERPTAKRVVVFSIILLILYVLTGIVSIFAITKYSLAAGITFIVCGVVISLLGIFGGCLRIKIMYISFAIFSIALLIVLLLYLGYGMYCLVRGIQSEVDYVSNWKREKMNPDSDTPFGLYMKIIEPYLPLDIRNNLPKLLDENIPFIELTVLQESFLKYNIWCLFGKYDVLNIRQYPVLSCEECLDLVPLPVNLQNSTICAWYGLYNAHALVYDSFYIWWAVCLGLLIVCGISTCIVSCCSICSTAKKAAGK